MGKDQELLDAARNGNITVIGKLLDQIAKRSAGPLSSFRRSPSINNQDMNGYTPLHHACLNGHQKIVCLLLAHDAQPDVPDIRGSTPLYLASWAGHQDIVKMLLMHPRKPANPNAQTIDNETPLHCAAQHGHNAALAILLAYGADPSIRNDSFQTALDLAAQFGRLQAVQILIRTHPELIEPYKATTASTYDLANYLPQHFAATSPTKHIFTHTCLHLASRNGHKKVVETLLAAGIDVNILTHSGSALHEAALCGKKSVVTTLLEAGINPFATDGNGRTALDILKDYPPHVTYGIYTAIEDFCKKIQNGYHFKPITMEENNEDTNFITTFENDMREKSHSIPKSACIKKLNEREFKPITRSNSGLSSSLDSINNSYKLSENYLNMKPIMCKKSSGDIHSTNKFKAYEDFTPNHLGNRIHGSNNCKNIYENLKSNQPLEDKNFKAPYRCIDEYVEMTEPNQQNSVTSTSQNPLESEKFFKAVESLKRNSIRQSNGSMDEDKEARDSVTPTNDIPIDANNNNNKRHSPTPDFPPPSVTQAEHAILEFIHPPRPVSKKSNKRRSIHIEYIENNDEDLESFVMKHINLDENDEAMKSSIKALTPTPTPSSRASDCVEEFVSDVPFAGLFKGSTLNLASDEIDGFVYPRLRSPSLVKSVQHFPPKRNMENKEKEKEEESNSNSFAETFNPNEVWEEINSILESIGNEMKKDEEEEEDKIKSLVKDKEALAPQGLITPKPIKIRNPSELLLGMKSESHTKWCHSPNTLIYDQILYEVYYLGSTVIRELQGTISTRKSIQKLKRGETPLANEQESSILENCNNSTKYLKAANQQTKLLVGIGVSHIGVRFIDVTEKSTICVHDIQNINCVCQDATDLRYFAYITKEQELHYCHVFMVDNLDLATEIILTLGQAFEVAYQLAMAEQDHSPHSPQ